MAELHIKVLKNGPLEVSGPVDISDPAGNAFPVTEDPIYLCRCGRSGNKPFCDGSHRKVGFEG
jgi:CDGSH-type Zn-finger protein